MFVQIICKDLRHFWEKKLVAIFVQGKSSKIVYKGTWNQGKVGSGLIVSIINAIVLFIKKLKVEKKTS